MSQESTACIEHQPKHLLEDRVWPSHDTFTPFMPRRPPLPLLRKLEVISDAYLLKV